MLASSGGVLKDSAILTRTSGVLAISEMLAVGACWARAIEAWPTAAAAANVTQYFRMFMRNSSAGKEMPPDLKTREFGNSFERFKKNNRKVQPGPDAGKQPATTFHPFRPLG
jgi:hypothetical protein